MRRLLAATAVGLVAALLGQGCLAFHAGALPDEPKDATFRQVEDVRVRYVDSGGPAEQPAVVLLHGFASSLDAWEPVRPTLEATHRVIALDMKGFGWSSRPEGDYSPAAQAQLVFQLLDELGVKRAAVVGHSWGASVALAMALAQPARVSRLVLYDAWAYEDQLPAFFVWARARGWGEVLFRLFYKERAEDRMTLAFHDEARVTMALVDKVEAGLARPGTVAAALAAVRGQQYADVQARYARVTQPVLLLWGREDRVTPLWVGERLAAQLPRARLRVFGACGHFPMIEARHASTRALSDFLGASTP